MEILVKAQMEMSSIIAERKLLASLTRNLPYYRDYVYKKGDQELIYSEKQKEWIGPFIVTDQKERMIWAKQPDKEKIVIFNSFQCEPFFTHTYFQKKNPLQNAFGQFKSNECPRTPLFLVNITEVVIPGDPREQKFDEAKNEEPESLVKRGTWKVVCKEEVVENAKIVNGRSFLAIKGERTKNEIWKAQFVVRGHKDKIKQSLPHYIPVARHHSIKLLVGLASKIGFRIFSSDVTQAYIQSTKPLIR